MSCTCLVKRPKLREAGPPAHGHTARRQRNRARSQAWVPTLARALANLALPLPHPQAWHSMPFPHPPCPAIPLWGFRPRGRPSRIQRQYTDKNKVLEQVNALLTFGK